MMADIQTGRIVRISFDSNEDGTFVNSANPGTYDVHADSGSAGEVAGKFGNAALLDSSSRLRVNGNPLSPLVVFTVVGYFVLNGADMPLFYSGYSDGLDWVQSVAFSGGTYKIKLNGGNEVDVGAISDSAYHQIGLATDGITVHKRTSFI